MGLKSEGYRHELKFIIAAVQMEILQNRLMAVSEKDRYAQTGYYTIRSLYFDDYGHTCFYENENGVDPREKFRIRLYNGETDYIRLELKRKEHNLTQKLSCPISREQVETVLSDSPLPNFHTLPPLLKKFELQRKCRLLKPDVIVEYDRIPYVCSPGNVRITFDMDIRTSSQFQSFLEKEQFSRLIMPSEMLVLEVKYDEFLPEYLENLLSTETSQRSSFSKYYLCKYFAS